MAKDYYRILGVERQASKDDIKKAFRTLAHKYHPDKKGGDESKFKEASEAYSVLSDDKKRAEYDTFGSAQSGGSPGGPGGFDFSGFNSQGFEFNMEDLGDIFGGFSDIFGMGNRNRQARGRDISIDIELAFHESVFGLTRRVLMTKDSTCSHCTGSGAEPGTKTKDCPTCNGKGQVVESRRSPFGTFSVSSTCSSCKGRRVVPEKPCVVCKGNGVERRQEEVAVSIPAGIEDGQVIRMGGLGEAISGGATGDLYVKVRVRKDKIFRKEGYNLVMDLPVKISDALTGSSKKIETLDGITEVKIPPLKSSDEILRVRGKGVPVGQGRRGDLLIRVRLDFPEKLSPEAKNLLEKLKKEGI